MASTNEPVVSLDDKIGLVGSGDFANEPTDTSKGNDDASDASDAGEGDDQKVDDKGQKTDDQTGTFDGDDDQKTDDQDDDASSDDTQYEINDDEDLVDDKGEIVAKKGEFTVDDDGNVTLKDDEGTVVSVVADALSKTYGVNFVDETGKALNTAELEESDETLINLVNTTVEHAVTADRRDFFSKQPKVAAYYQHLLAGGTDETYFSSKSVSTSINLPEDNDTSEGANRLRKQIVVEELIKGRTTDGMTTDQLAALRKDAERYADMLEDSDGLVAGAKTSKELMDVRKSAFEKERDRRNKEALNIQQEENRKYWTKVKTTIENRDLNGITVPQDKVDDFYDFIANPSKNGRTREELAMEEEPIEKTLQIALMRYLGFDLNALVALQKNKETVANLKRRRSKPKINIGRENSGTRQRKGGVDISDISIDNLLP